MLETLRNQIRVYVMNALRRKGLRPETQRPPPHLEDEDSDEFVGLLIVREFLDTLGLPHTAGMLVAESGKDLSVSRFELLEHTGLTEDDGRPALLQIIDRCRKPVASANEMQQSESPAPSESARSSALRVTETEPAVREVSSASTYSEELEESVEPPNVPSVAKVQRHSGMIRSTTGWESRGDDSNDFIETEDTGHLESHTEDNKADLSLEELADMDDDLEDDFQLASSEIGAGGAAVANPQSRPAERAAEQEMGRKVSWDEKSDSFESTNEEFGSGYDPSKSIIEDQGSQPLFQRGQSPAVAVDKDEDYGEDFEESLSDSIEEEISVGEEESDAVEAEHYHIDQDRSGGGLSRSTGGFLKTLPRLEREDENELPPTVLASKAPLTKSLEDDAGSDLEALSVGGVSDDGGFFEDNNPSDKSW